MSALGQRTLVSLLTDRDALEYVALEGLDLAVVPNEQLRGAVAFALDYFHSSGRLKAPTVGVLFETFGDLFNDEEIDFENTEESIEWAVEDLRATFVHKEVSTFNKTLATAMAEAEVADRVEVVNTYASELVSLATRMQSNLQGVDLRTAVRERLVEYEARANIPDLIQGMAFGLGPVDQHTHGIHPGELAVLAAGPKIGKSYFCDYVALREFQRGRIAVLYTLENSIEMTVERIACAAAGVSAEGWQSGTLIPEQVDQVRHWVNEFEKAEVPLYVRRPDLRTPEALVREAQMLGAQSLIIDQTSHMDHPDVGRKPRHEVVREQMQMLKRSISTGHDQIPCLLAHQINREGVESSRKTGFVLMHHLAESAEVERTPDWVFALHQGEEEKRAMRAKFQTLAARRARVLNWELDWWVDMGQASVRREISLDEAA